METREQILQMLLRPAERKSPDEVVYEAFQADDPSFQRVLDDGSTQPDGFKLSLLRKLLNGDEGYVSGPRNTLYPVSLKRWADVDPETTYLRIKVPSLKSLNFPKQPPLTPEEISQYEFRIEVSHVGNGEALLFFPSTGSLLTKGVSLADQRRRLGGDEGYIEGLEGKRQYVSLKPWANEDPELTFIQFNYIQRPVDVVPG